MLLVCSVVNSYNAGLVTHDRGLMGKKENSLHGSASSDIARKKISAEDRIAYIEILGS
jgi:hypothetical protein